MKHSVPTSLRGIFVPRIVPIAVAAGFLSLWSCAGTPKAPEPPPAPAEVIPPAQEQAASTTPSAEEPSPAPQEQAKATEPAEASEAPVTAPPEAPPPKAEPKPPTKLEVVKEAALALKKGDPRGALAAFQKLPGQEAADPDMVLIQSAILVSSGHPDDAKALISPCLERNPDDADLLYALASAEGARGDGKARDAALEATLKANPKHSDALTDLGDQALRKKIYKRALSYYDQALATDAWNQRAIIGKVRVLSLTGQTAETERLLDSSIDHYPGWAEPLIERGCLLRDAGKTGVALKDFDAAIALEDGYWNRLERGKALMDAGRVRDALSDFEAAVSINDRHFLAWVYIAGLREMTEDWEGAEEANRRIIALNPDYYFAYESLGTLSIKNGRWAEAKDAFLQAYRRGGTQHSDYALLAALAWARAEGPRAPRTFLELALKAVPRESLEWYVLRLYYDQAGDTNVAVIIDKEKNKDTRARMLYYLAEFYTIRGKDSLALRYHQQVQALGRKGMLEWRLNEWALAAAASGSGS